MSVEFNTYRAREKGFDGVKVRKAGETFTSDIPQGSWMDLLDKDGNVVARPKAEPAPGDALTADIDTVAAASVERLKNALDDKDAAISAKDARIAELEAQLVDASKASSAPAAAPTGQQEPGPLDKSIPDLTAYLETVSDLGALDALIEAEKGGKSRSGALEALEARKAALQGI